MKKAIIFLLAISGMQVYSQSLNYIIEGQIGKINKPAKMLLISYPDSREKIDSVELKNGKFRFSGSVQEISKAILLLDHTGKDRARYDRPLDVINIFLENGKTVVTANDSLRHSTIFGSRENELQLEMDRRLKKYEDSIYAIMGPHRANGASPQLQEEMYDKIRAARSAELVRFIKEYPDNMVSLFAMEYVSRPIPDPKILAPVYAVLSERIRNTDHGQRFGRYIRKLQAVEIGEMAPEIAQPDSSGNIISLSGLKGKYVLVDFWASWCIPCREENPGLVKAYAAYKNKNFVILGVGVERKEDRALWLQAIEKDKLTWLHISDFKYWDNEAIKLYAISGIPQNFLIDPTGKIIGRNLKGEQLMEKLEEVLN